MFENFDFSDFWCDSQYALDEYVGESPTDEYIESIEKELGYKLPESYKYLIKQHNGGIPNNTAFKISINASIVYFTPYSVLTNFSSAGRDRSTFSVSMQYAILKKEWR